MRPENPYKNMGLKAEIYRGLEKGFDQGQQSMLDDGYVKLPVSKEKLAEMLGMNFYELMDWLEGER